MKTPLFSLCLIVAASRLAWAAPSTPPKQEVVASAEAPESTTEAKATPEQLDFFERKIRPVLSEKCYKCHSEKSDKVKGGLVLDTREGIRRGGDSGPAVVPGDLKESLLIDAIRYTNKDFSMPPEKQGGKLPEATIKDFEDWVKMGAPDSRDGAAKVVKKFSTEEAKQWWSFQDPKKAAVPQAKNASWPRGEIDRFLLAALEAKGLKPVADADKLTLLRRTYFALTGLPPGLPDTDGFLKDLSPDAFTKVVDRLLASPQFGERWGRQWLDVARYAESSGRDVNIAFPNAWRYRDYVINAFNADKPYDQFVREQVAGDLLPADNDRQRASQVIATGFLAVGSKGLNEQNSKQFFLDLVDEQIDTVSQAFMGMTIACARCHDHKFDPIPQRDYYALAGIFLSTDTRYGTAGNAQNRHASELVELPEGTATLGKTLTAADREKKERNLAELKKELETLTADRREDRKEQKSDNAAQPANPAMTENAAAAPVKPAPKQPQGGPRPLVVATQIAELEAELKGFYPDGSSKPFAMAVQDLPLTRQPRQPGGRGAQMRLQFRAARPTEFSAVSDAPLYTRGDASKPAERIPRGFPELLSDATTPQIPAGTSGRRELAEWLVSKGNPLTARVMVNRVWYWLFGRGLVDSVDNFGTTGKKPDNQELLDTLAVRFMEQGWSVKKLVREIVLSHAYQLSSAYDEKCFAADPENTLVWRVSKRRLDAECIRDAMLSVSRQLQATPPLGSMVAEQGNAPLGGPRNRASLEDALLNAGGTMLVRSVYLPVAREMIPDALAVFDFAEPSLVTGSRDSTNVPSQALFMLNSDFVTKQAGALADRVMNAYPAGENGGVGVNFNERTNFAYWLVFGRPPTQPEKNASWLFFSRFPSDWQKGDKSGPAVRDSSDVKAAWISYCRALFASSDFRYVN